MKDFNAAGEEAVAGPVTAPQFLVEITLDKPYFLSTRSQVEHNGQIFEPGGVRILHVSGDRVELEIENHSYQHSRAALNGDYNRQPVTVWWAYPPKHVPHYVRPGYWQDGYTPAPDDASPPIRRMFQGVTYVFPEVDFWLSVTARRTPPQNYPFAKVRPPKANHAPTAGYTVQFDGQVFRVEGRR